MRLRRALRIDTRDARAFPVAARRARVLRALLAGGALALLVAAAASARDLDTREKGLLPSDSTGVVILDLSLSIADSDYAGVRQALRRLVADDSRIGLVVFSDVAYELLPPGVPASELEPLLRLLVNRKDGSPVNPWTQSFRAGTRISSALELARGMLERDAVENPSILLVSDLETAPEDVPVLTRTIEGLRQSSIELRVAAIRPSSDARRIFAGSITDESFVLPEGSAEEPRPSPRAAQAIPTALLALGALLFLVLAAHERFAARLALPVAASPSKDAA